MRTSKVIIGLLLLMLSAKNASAQKVMVDYDPGAYFSPYKTFLWIEQPHVRIDLLMGPRLVNVVNAALTSKGWQLVDTNADVGIVAHVATKERHTLHLLPG
jgi:hypothetical protein